MTDHYAVIGNPIAHSKSPLIHAEFAKQCRQDLHYGRILAPVDGFRDTVARLQAEGYKGCNVTVPFKLEAWKLSTSLTRRAEDAESVNTLSFQDGGIYGDNTDGAGLVRDIGSNLGFSIRGSRILLMGAGGAARGVIRPLHDEGPAEIFIANRTVEKAKLLGEKFGIGAGSYEDLSGKSFDIVINATSSSLKEEVPPLPQGIFAQGSLAYDMMYGKEPTVFLKFAEAAGAKYRADGLGMLVEQAAESFYIWRGMRPETGSVIAKLRSC